MKYVVLKLTARERDVRDLLARGLSNKEIAVKLHISERTAKFHVSSLLKKFGVENRQEVVCLLCDLNRP